MYEKGKWYGWKDPARDHVFYVKDIKEYVGLWPRRVKRVSMLIINVCLETGYSLGTERLTCDYKDLVDDMDNFEEVKAP